VSYIPFSVAANSLFSSVMPIVIRLRLFLTQFLALFVHGAGRSGGRKQLKFLALERLFLGEGESLRAKKSVCWIGWGGEEMVTSLEQWF